MRLSYPLNDKPIFHYWSIPIALYDWSQRKPAQKIRIYIFQGLYATAFLAFVSGVHSFSWTSVGTMGRSFLIVLLFPLLVFPIIFAFRAKYPKRDTSIFYREWARVYTGIGKGQNSFFFGEDVESLSIKSAVLDGQTFYLAKVRFKPWLGGYLGRRGNLRFGIVTENEEALNPLREWAISNKVAFEIEPQRSS